MVLIITTIPPMVGLPGRVICDSLCKCISTYILVSSVYVCVWCVCGVCVCVWYVCVCGVCV